MLNSNQKTKERMYKKIMKSVQDLEEDFDSVQIFLTKHVKINKLNEDTESYVYGSGNKFAIYGQVKTWVKSEEIAFQEMHSPQSGEQEDGDEIN